MLDNDNKIEYLVVGTVTQDIVEDGLTPGGTVTYSGRIAQALGCKTAILTSARPDYDLSPFLNGIEVHLIPSENNSVFDNIYQGNERIQILHSRSGDIRAQDVPETWHNTPVVHLGPLTNEVEPAMIDLFSNSMVGLTPQGWMRRWGEDGRIYAQSFPAEQELLCKAAATVISEEDLLDDTMLERYINWANILVMTQNYAGCTVFVDGESYQIPAPMIKLIEPTGAGDIFAAAFFVRLWQTDGDPIKAAEWANLVAAHSVTKENLDEKVVAWQAA
ncbi:MAG: PfkB family carbohydrate kinase [Chloroflexota bacterium]